ncbi:hypothetical protein C8J56DRAFT_1133900 [Mycena floridula]|nr:hypothetical protein C8J56DRAFT_1133900 [Mycena floridula]
MSSVSWRTGVHQTSFSKTLTATFQPNLKCSGKDDAYRETRGRSNRPSGLPKSSFLREWLLRHLKQKAELGENCCGCGNTAARAVYGGIGGKRHADELEKEKPGSQEVQLIKTSALIRRGDGVTEKTRKAARSSKCSLAVNRLNRGVFQTRKGWMSSGESWGKAVLEQWSTSSSLHAWRRETRKLWYGKSMEFDGERVKDRILRQDTASDDS